MKIINWLPYIAVLIILITLFFFGKWGFMFAGVIIGSAIMLCIGYVIDKKRNG